METQNQKTQVVVETSDMKRFNETLKSYEKSITHLLNNKYGITPQEFYVSAVYAVKQTPKLLECDPSTLFGAILMAAECGLRFNTPEQHAFILPYKKVAKFQIGYQGLVEMMYRNPRISMIDAVAVYEKDEFDYWYGLNPNLIHKPARGEDRGELTCVYAVCGIKDADRIFTVVERAELERIKNMSPNKDNEFSPYNNGKDVHNWMQVKAAIKKISKLIPKSAVPELSKAIQIDSKIEGGAVLRARIPMSAEDIVEADLIETETTSKPSKKNTFDDVINEAKQPELIQQKQEDGIKLPREKHIPYPPETKQMRGDVPKEVVNTLLETAETPHQSNQEEEIDAFGSLTQEPQKDEFLNELKNMSEQEQAEPEEEAPMSSFGAGVDLGLISNLAEDEEKVEMPEAKNIPNLFVSDKDGQGSMF
jgi:recombination protein RecT